MFHSSDLHRVRHCPVLQLERPQTDILGYIKSVLETGNVTRSKIVLQNTITLLLLDAHRPYL